jgi:Xaa-Pro aminopeptidase
MHWKRWIGVSFLLLVWTASALAAQTATGTGMLVPEAPRVLTHREQAALVRAWTSKRFDEILPGLMRREGIDMWIVVTREYNNDPVFSSMAPLTTYSSRRRTILVFTDRGEGRGVERLSIGRFDYDGLFEVVKTLNHEQWKGLREVVEARDPKVIGVDTSELWNHADGLTANEEENLLKALGPKYSARVRSAEMLAVGWLETKLPEETEAYRHVMQVAHSIIREAFSNRVIVPGTTTTEDVAWWMRQRVAELGLGSWFQPSVDIQRRGGAPKEGEPGYGVIERGDLLHCDFGIVYLGFSTDTQHNAYVLAVGEMDAPAGLKAGQRAGNRLQDIVMDKGRPGVSGNVTLAESLQQAESEGLVPSIYCHAIGFHGHGAGAPIGMTDYQEGVPGRGERELHAGTWSSIELNVTHAVPEWGGQDVRFALEEDASLQRDGWHWIDGRQSELYLVY